MRRRPRAGIGHPPVYPSGEGAAWCAGALPVSFGTFRVRGRQVRSMPGLL